MKKILFIILLFLCYSAIAQEDAPMRVEVQARAGSDNYYILPFGKAGVLLFCRSNEATERDKALWVFTFYDVNFQELWNKELKTERNLRLSHFENDESRLYMFMEKVQGNITSDEFRIITLDIDDVRFSTVSGVHPEKAEVKHFRVAGGKAFLAGHTVPGKGVSCLQSACSITLIPLITGATFIRYQPSLVTVDLATGAVRNIPLPYKGQAWVESIEVMRESSTLSVVVKQHIRSNNNQMHLLGYDLNGNKISDVTLNTENPARKLNTARPLKLSQDEELIIGTYNTRVRGANANPAHGGFTEGATGMYICGLEGGSQKFIRFYNFSEFKNFFSYLSDKRALRIKKKAMKKQARGGEIEFDYQILLHDIIVRDDNYILLGEVYYPEYRTVTYTSYDANGRPYTTSYTVFEGYRYTSAVIACFDKNGQLLWDNNFEIWNILTYRLKKRVKTLFDGDDIVLTYSEDGEIASKVISGNEVVERKDVTEIKSKYKNDKVLNDYNSDMDYWYGNYFITYGYQKIRNQSEQGRSKRTVFYFNKIGFR